ncbi:MAG: hypothetical protein ACI4OR_02060 [Alphaproteobacteria bacterium]
MKILQALYEKLCRLIISLCYQIPWILMGTALHFYAHQTFPEKIQSAFSVAEAQSRLAQATQAAAFMKDMISVSNPVASVNYLTSLVSQTTAWSRLNTSQMFATASTAFCLWLVDAFLFLGGIYLVWRVYKTYRQKGHQKENAQLILKELSPCFKELQNEIRQLREEVWELKNEKSGFTNPPDAGR